MPSATPNVADFATWVTNVMRVPAAYLPAGSPYLGYALNQALAVANLDLACLPTVPGAYTLYDLACYNLAGALLAEYAPDQSYPIASVSWAGGAASVTTAGPNAVQPGDSLVLNGISPAAYNGPLTAYGFGPVRVSAVPSATQFSYPLLPQPPGLVNVLPTGRNFYSVDPRAVPSRLVAGQPGLHEGSHAGEPSAAQDAMGARLSLDRAEIWADDLGVVLAEAMLSVTKDAPGALRCPFCGSQDVHNWVSDDHGPGSWSMMCFACECEGPHTDSEIESVALWNRRMP